MEKIFLRSPIKLISEALLTSIQRVTGLTEKSIPIIPFAKSNDWDYQSAFANKMYNQFKKSKPDVSETVSDKLVFVWILYD